jgi:hypothetical protein
MISLYHNNYQLDRKVSIRFAARLSHAVNRERVFKHRGLRMGMQLDHDLTACSLNGFAEKVTPEAIDEYAFKTVPFRSVVCHLPYIRSSISGNVA